MTAKNRPELTVIKNNNYETEVKPKPTKGYHTNPMYEKLVKFTNDKKRRFTVEDLLKW